MYTAPPKVQSSSDLSFFSKSKSSKSGTTTTTVRSTTVTTRLVQKQPAVKVIARDATPLNSRSASISTPLPVIVKKRKLATKEAETQPTKVKKPRLSRSPTGSRASSLAPSARRTEPPTRQSSLAPGQVDSISRSTSVSAPEVSIARECWIEDDGRPGDGFLSNEEVVKRLMHTYKAYFTNPENSSDTSFEPHETNYPVVELEFPNDHASERYILLEPKDKDHYNPIMCLESSLHTIVEHYLTPEQQALFGKLPNTTLLDVTDDSDDATDRNSTPAPSAPRDAVSPSPSVSSALSSISSSSVSSTSSVLSTLSSLSSISSLSALSSFLPSTIDTTHPIPESTCFDFPRRLRRAMNKHDGPQFLKVMDAINTLLRCFKYPSLSSDPFDPTPPNTLLQAVKTWTPTGIPNPVFTRIIEETYQRAVGPNVGRLKNYTAFSSEVYGELMPKFVSEIIRLTGLKPDSLFVDLGSGVGNVALQTSLETGCTSYGIELLPDPAEIAASQLEQMKTRCRMWGVKMGEVTLEQGDMLKSSKVDELVAKADVVLVNNKVFEESLNEQIKPKFLDLKEGAIVVSLKSFVSSNRLTERNVDDISAIFQVAERKYYPGSVSWGSGGGSYFMHKVDREGYANDKKRLESSRSSSVRSTRSRR